MERKASYKLINLAAYFFVATVMVQMVPVKACQTAGESCATLACCDEIACIDGICVDCEDHVGHSCEPGVRECCDEEIACVKDSIGEYKCTDCEVHIGHSCDVRECCPGRECVGDPAVCECVLKENDPCIPGESDCCDLECVAVSATAYQCQVV